MVKYSVGCAQRFCCRERTVPIFSSPFFSTCVFLVNFPRGQTLTYKQKCCENLHVLHAYAMPFLFLRAKILGECRIFFAFRQLNHQILSQLTVEKNNPRKHISNSRYRNIIMASSEGSAALQCLCLYCHWGMVRSVLRKSRIQAYMPSYAN